MEHTEVLGHGVGLNREGVELVGVDGELLLDDSQGFVVNEEEDLDSISHVSFTIDRVRKLLTVP
jgi:hypothetical protein